MSMAGWRGLKVEWKATNQAGFRLRQPGRFLAWEELTIWMTSLRA